MKTTFLLCVVMTVGLVLGGCANQKSASNARASTTERGTEPGVTGTGGGGGGSSLPLHTQY